MKWNRLLLIPIVFAGLASIGGTGSDDPRVAMFNNLDRITSVVCPAASLAVNINILAVPPAPPATTWTTTATGSVTCTTTTPPTPLRFVQVLINWPWNQAVVVTTNAAGNFTATATTTVQPKGTAIAGVQPGAPPGGAQPGPVTATSNKL